ncbi:MAG: SGNH/GDSL hydrolase family protein [Bacteroidales bacterium]|nr:SGNH/GDSL hydrolase family protein [Bacteroidales bacterium]
MKTPHILLLLALMSLMACQPELNDFTTSSGQADFTTYVAIGNSLTAGYADGELYRSGQENSYPAILATQMKAAGCSEFRQPLMYDEYGFGRRLLLNASIPGPVPAGFAPDQRNFESIAAAGPFHNMGVPGAKSFHLLIPGYAALNPYFGRFATNASTTVLTDAAAINPTFFSCWIGNNDVLAYALTGASADSITDINTFSYAMNTILQTLTANGAEGAIANIPDITNIPYFTFMNTRLPYYGLVLDAATAATLNGAYAAFEQYLADHGVTWSYGFNFAEGPNAFVVTDETLPLPAPFNVRQMKAGELFMLTLPTDSILNHGMGAVNQAGPSPMPYGIPDKFFLSEGEISEIKTATQQFNEVIASLADTYGLALADMNGKFNQMTSTGITVDGIIFTDEFITGNTFSLDGVHLTAQGYALVANIFIEAINAKYSADLKPVSPRLYPGIYYYQ